MNKGIVMEMTDDSLIVMTPDGSFEQIRRNGRNCQVGEEILFARRSLRKKAPLVALASTVSAAVVFCLVLMVGWSNFFAGGGVVAYVSIDINPSIEIGIDNDQKVLELNGLNADGENLIKGIDFKGKKLEKLTDDLLMKAEELPAMKSGEADIIITSSLVNGKSKLSDTAISDQLQREVAAHIKDKHPNAVDKYEVTSFPVPAELREKAKEANLSPGKYSVYLTAKENGQQVTVEQLKTTSIHQIAKEVGGLDQLINPGSLNANSLKTLITEEKSGELSKKFQEKQSQKQKEKEDEDKKKSKASPTPTPKATPKPTAKPNFTPAKQTIDPKKNDNKQDDKNDNRQDVKQDGKQTSGKTNDPKSTPKNNDNKKDDDNKNDDSKKNNDSNKNDDNGKNGSSNGSIKKNDDAKKNDDKNKQEDDKRKVTDKNGNSGKNNNKNDGGDDRSGSGKATGGNRSQTPGFKNGFLPFTHS